MDHRISNLENLCELITKEVIDQNKNMIDMNKNLISEIRALREAYVKQDEDFEEFKTLLRKIYDLNRQNFTTPMFPPSIPPVCQPPHLPPNFPGPINNTILDQINQSMLNNLSFQSVQTPLNQNHIQNSHNLNQTMPTSASAMNKPAPPDFGQLPPQQKSVPNVPLPPFNSSQVSAFPGPPVKPIQTQVINHQAQSQQLGPTTASLKFTPNLTTTSTPQANQFLFKPPQQSNIQIQMEKPKPPIFDFSPTKSTETKSISSIPPSKSDQISFTSTTPQSTSNIFSGTNLFKPPESTKQSPFSNLPSTGNIFKLTATNVSNTISALVTKPIEETEDSEVVGNPEDYEPQAEFKPIVQLKEVEVKTGEEDEDVLFKQRCKLFRFDSGAKEWKEKGIGELKLLKHKETKLIRILMRREQVLKICANHRVTDEMKLNQLSPKQLSWMANDFSENEAKTEMLLAQFKTPEEASQFKTELEKAIKEMKNFDISKSSVKEKKTPLVISNKPSLAEALKTDSWKCSACYAPNKNDDIKCACCSTQKLDIETKFKENKPITQQLTLESDVGKKFSFGLQPEQQGQKIEFLTKEEKIVESKAEPILFERSTMPSFSSLSENNGFVIANSKENANSTSLFKTLGFTGGFGSQNNQTTSLFGNKPTPLFGQVSKAEEGEEEGDNQNPEEYEPQVEFKPLVKLNEVEVKTGEENEEILFKQRCKLFRFDSKNKEWKEKGVGELKILKHKIKENNFRVLMRRDQVLKICANHRITPEIKLELINEKQVRWLANDCSEGTPHTEFLAAKFRSEEEAKKFVGEFEKLQKFSKNISSTSSTQPNEVISDLASKLKKEQGSWACQLCLTVNKPNMVKCASCGDEKPDKKEMNEVKIVYEAKPTIEQIEKARSLGLPDTFYLYENKPDCKGCIGCKNEQ